MIFKSIALLSIAVSVSLPRAKLTATRADIQTKSEIRNKSRDYKYQCVVFDHKANQVILRGHLNAASFQQMFKQDYSMTGKRNIETPTYATPFGALVLTDGSEIVTMPLYKWQRQKKWLYACQGYRTGKAPAFSVLEDGQQKFFKQMSLQLNEK